MARNVPRYLTPAGLIYDERCISSHCLKGHCTKGQALQYLARSEKGDRYKMHFDTLGTYYL